MELFRNDDAGYRSWIERHADGYIVNLNTLGKNRSMIHTSRCGHLYEPETTRTHTIAYGKACSQDWQELIAWAKANGHTLAECSSCEPQ